MKSALLGLGSGLGEELLFGFSGKLAFVQDERFDTRSLDLIEGISMRAAPERTLLRDNANVTRKNRSWIWLAGFSFLVAMLLVLAIYFLAKPKTSPIVQYGSDSSISPLRRLMGLSDMPLRYAPTFKLTDQFGAPISLSQFRGHTVILAFMDSRCTTVCPVVTQEFQLAQKDLGSLGNKVDFVAVNINPLANSVADVVAFDQLHGLTNMQNWYFLTGPSQELLQIAQEYGITVIVPKNNDPNNIIHADYFYFVNSKGQERYLASPTVDQTKSGVGYLPQPTLTQWGQGIATYVKKITV